MALTTDTSLFKAIGATDPEVIKSGIAIKRCFSFKMNNATADVNYEFLPLPKGFVLTGVYVNEKAKCTAGTVTFKLKDSGDTIGAAVTVGGATLASTFVYPIAPAGAVPGGSKVYLAGEMLCFVGSVNMTDGEIEVVVHGFLVNGDTLNGYQLVEPYRESQSQAEYLANKSGGDLYLKKVEKNPTA